MKAPAPITALAGNFAPHLARKYGIPTGMQHSKNKTKLVETDTAAAVVDYLAGQGFTVYQEVSSGRASARADIVATRADLLVAVECKTALSLKVLEQAHHWHAHQRYIAIPYSRKHNLPFLSQLCTALELGVLEVRASTIWDDVNECYDTQYWCKQLIAAPEHACTPYQIEQLRAKLHPLQQVMAQAGSKGGGYYTPYQATIRQVRELIKASHEGMTIDDIMRNIGKAHYKTLASCRGSIQRALVTHEKDWCETDYQSGETRYKLRSA